MSKPESSPASPPLNEPPSSPPWNITETPSKIMQPFSSSSTTTTSNPMQQTSGYPQHQFQNIQGQMTGGLERVREWLQNWIQNAADTLRVYVNQYPPLAAFLFTLLVLSAVPISVYVLFGLVTSAIFLTIALIGFSFVEGFVLLTSGGILMTILGTVALFTTIGFAVLSTVYISYRGCCYLASNVWQASGQISSQVREAAQRATSQIPHQGGPSGFQSSMGGPAGGMGGSTSS